MNTDALTSRYGKIHPSLQAHVNRVWTHLQQQSDKVASVTFLENFAKDHDVSLQTGTDVYRGMVVALKPDYALTGADVLWMHPHAYQCRAIYDGGTFEHVAVPSMEASAGVYKVSSVDDIGSQCEQTYTVVDSRVPYTPAATPQASYVNTAKADTLEHCAELAAQMQAGELVEHAFTNLFLKDTHHYVFYNHAFHKKGVVHVSPLMGYRTVRANGAIAGDRMHAREYVDVEALSDPKKQELYQKCWWDSDNAVNTYALRKPFDTLARVGTHYRLQQGCFAETPIHHAMATQDLYKLSADLNNLGLKRFGHVETQQIRLPVREETVVRLLRLGDFDILNPQYRDADNLLLPKHIVEQLF